MSVCVVVPNQVSELQGSSSVYQVLPLVVLPLGDDDGDGRGLCGCKSGVVPPYLSLRFYNSPRARFSSWQLPAARKELKAQSARFRLRGNGRRERHIHTHTTHTQKIIIIKMVVVGSIRCGVQIPAAHACAKHALLLQR